MIGLRFKLNPEKRLQTTLGYQYFEVHSRYIGNTRQFVEHDDKKVTRTVYEYYLTLICYSDDGTVSVHDVPLDEIEEELIYGNYELVCGCGELISQPAKTKPKPKPNQKKTTINQPIKKDK